MNNIIVKIFFYAMALCGLFSVIVIVLKRISLTSSVNAGYSEWEPWGKCTPDCGISVKSRTRHCNLPVTERNFSPCQHLGPMVEVEPCKVPECNRDGKWGQYGSWSACVPNCQDGYRGRQRECDTPRQRGKGLPCQGPQQKQRFKCTGVKGVPPCNNSMATSKPAVIKKATAKPKLITTKPKLITTKPKLITSKPKLITSKPSTAQAAKVTLKPTAVPVAKTTARSLVTLKKNIVKSKETKKPST